MTFKNKIRLRLISTRLFRIAKIFGALLFPLLLALSSLWIDILISIVPSNISMFLVSNKGGLVSLLGILAGAYLTLFATYFLKKNSDIRKDIAIKELSFYTPIYAEFKRAFKIKEKEKIWIFNKSANNIQGMIPWMTWEEINNSLVIYVVPTIFVNRLNKVNNQINEYIKVYNYTAKFCQCEVEKIEGERNFVRASMMGYKKTRTR